MKMYFFGQPPKFIFALVFVICSGILHGQQISQTKSDPLLDKFNDLVRTNAYPVKIENGYLTGEGERFLKTVMDKVQFVAFGEAHNRRAIHHFGGALFRLLHSQYAFNYLALEEDPYLGQLCSAASRKGGREELIKLALRYPNAFQLLTEEELEMIGDIGKISKARMDQIWGLNQVFGATHIYERLLQLAPNANASSVLQKLLNTANEYEKERFQKGRLYMSDIAKAEDFEKLRKAFRPKAGSEADRLIYQLALSNEIFSPYSAQPRPAPEAFFNSGIKRETNMKRLFAERYHEAQSKGDQVPKVMAMFGQLHLYRGLSEQTDLFTLGNYFSEIAIFHNMKSFHIYAEVDLPFAHQGWRNTLVKAIENIGDRSDDAVIVDLRPLRAFAITRNPDSSGLDQSLRRVILSYDAFLFLRDGKAGSLDRLRTPHFRWYGDEK